MLFKFAGDVLKATEEFLCGPPGECGGVIGTIVNAVVDHPEKAAAVVAAGVATGGLAYVAAPTIATVLGSTGVLGTTTGGAVISSLKGASLTSASLAKIGGGALASGGGGVSAGTVVMGTSGAAMGTGISTGVAAAA